MARPKAVVSGWMGDERHHQTEQWESAGSLDVGEQYRQPGRRLSSQYQRQECSLAGGRSTASQLAQWFDTSTFSQPASFTFGNVSRTLSDVRSPGVVNFDVSLFKNLVFKERVTLQFRSEFFNCSEPSEFRSA